MRSPLVTIIIPYVREDGADRCIQAVEQNAGVCDCTYDIMTKHDTDKIGCPKMVKRMTFLAHTPMVCFLGDDTIPQKDFLLNAMLAMRKLPKGWGLVGLNDGSNHDFACHWLAHKNLLPSIGRTFFHTGYSHCYCDKELTDKCQRLGRYIYAEDAKITHANPFIDPKVKRDEHYDRAYNEATVTADRELYLARKKMLEKDWGM